MLSKLTRGNPRHPPLIFLHGFLGSKEDWEEIIPFFEGKYYCIAFDLHCEDILAAVKTEIQLIKEKPILIGYSMGGRIGLILKELAKKLIVISGHPGLKTDKEKAERMSSDEKWSKELLDLPFETFLSKWYAQPVFHRSYTRRTDQKPELLARVLMQMSLSHQTYSDEFPCPTLFLCGEYDLKYRELYRALPSAVTVCEIKECSHAVHLDNPILCSKTILNWLNGHETP